MLLVYLFILTVVGVVERGVFVVFAVVGVVAGVVVVVVVTRVVDGAAVVVDTTFGTLLEALACVWLTVKGTILGAMVGFCTGCSVSITPTGPFRSASLSSGHVNSSACME